MGRAHDRRIRPHVFERPGGHGARGRSRHADASRLRARGTEMGADRLGRNPDHDHAGNPLRRHGPETERRRHRSEHRRLRMAGRPVLHLAHRPAEVRHVLDRATSPPSCWGTTTTITCTKRASSTFPCWWTSFATWRSPDGRPAFLRSRQPPGRQAGRHGHPRELQDGGLMSPTSAAT